MTTTQQHEEEVMREAFKETIAAYGCEMTIFETFCLGYKAGYAEKVKWSALQSQAQPDDEQPKLTLALPDYEKRRLVIASDEIIDGERLVCVAIQEAEQIVCCENYVQQAGNTVCCGEPITQQPTASKPDYEEVLAGHRRLVRELDVLLNGEEGAAKQASLCDIVSQVRAQGIRADAAPTDVRDKALEEAARALVKKLDEINSSEEYKSIWSWANVHGIVYNGPTYAAEISWLRDLLKQSPVPAQTWSDADIYEAADRFCVSSEGGWHFADVTALLAFARRLLEGKK